MARTVRGRETRAQRVPALGAGLLTPPMSGPAVVPILPVFPQKGAKNRVLSFSRFPSLTFPS